MFDTEDRAAMLNQILIAFVPLFAAAGFEDPPQPSPRWSADHAAHLLRRAGFGGTPEQVEYLARLGRENAIEYLLNYEKIPDTLRPPALFPPPDPPPRGASREEQQRYRMQQRRRDQLQFQRIVQWWIDAMVSTPRPLQEKMVLFWHGHFTSGYREVRSSRALFIQNQMFRSNALGNFRDFLIDVTEDPAMILYLNTQQNVRGKPNENYARELMELFTLGEGQYTEKDIREAARAFTGLKANPRTGEALYVARQHDFGRKEFLGRKGEFDPADIIDIILEQPAAAEHVVRRLWTFFAYEDPEPELVQTLAGIFRDSDYELKPLMRALFTADAFYSDRARHTHIKSPVELVVGTLRSLEMPAHDTFMLANGLRAMGQELMQPPNVKGWDGGATWITTSTLFNRYNMLAGAVFGTDNDNARRMRRRMVQAMQESAGAEAMMSEDDLPQPQPAYDPAPVLEKHNLKTPEQVVDHYVQRLLQRRIAPDRRKTLIDAFKESMKDRDVRSPRNADAVRGLLHLIMSMPEYQLS